MASGDSSSEGSGAGSTGSGGGGGGDVPPFFTPEQVASYDARRLIAQYREAAKLVRRMNKKPDSVRAAAAALCTFFHSLQDEPVFWQAAAAASGVTKPQVQALLDELEGDAFEDTCHDFLERSGLEDPDAATITDQLAAALLDYEPGDADQVQRIRDGIDFVEARVCDTRVNLAKGEERRRLARWCTRALLVGGAALSVVALAPVAATTATALVVIGGTSSLTGTIAEIVQDIRDE